MTVIKRFIIRFFHSCGPWVMGYSWGAMLGLRISSGRVCPSCGTQSVERERRKGLLMRGICLLPLRCAFSCPRTTSHRVTSEWGEIVKPSPAQTQLSFH